MRVRENNFFSSSQEFAYKSFVSSPLDPLTAARFDDAEATPNATLYFQNLAFLIDDVTDVEPLRSRRVEERLVLG